MSLTGSNADRRFRLSPDEQGSVLSQLAVRLATHADVSPPTGDVGESPIPEHDLAALTDRLWDSRGECLVVCDSQEIPVQGLVNSINHLLGNYGKTIDIERPSRQRQGNDGDVIQLIEELKGGKVAALFVAGTDLTHNLPGRDELAAAIKNVPLVVTFAEREDDVSSLAHFVCPDHHPLESWLDAEPVSGVVSISQPTLEPLGATRSILESLERWSGGKRSAYEILQNHWEKHILPRSKSQEFRPFWDRAVHDGFAEVGANPVEMRPFQADAVRLVSGQSDRQDFTLSLYSKIGMSDSRHAHNPWLQELPDPVTKVTWDNYVCLSSATAEKLELSDGDIVRVEVGGRSIELPTLIQPGQHDRVLAIALGYGGSRDGTVCRDRPRLAGGEANARRRRTRREERRRVSRRS